MAGQTVDCPQCKTTIRVPTSTGAQVTANSRVLGVWSLTLSILSTLICVGTLVAVSARPRLVPVSDPGTAVMEKLDQMQRELTGLKAVRLPAVSGGDQLAAAQRDIAAMNQRLQKLTSDLARQNLDFDFVLYKMKADRTTATLDPTSPGPFDTVESSCGTFFVSLEDAQPYLNGVRVTLNVGNPMTCSYNGAKVTVKFGPAFDQKRLSEDGYYDTYQKSLQTKVVDITDKIEAGRWTTVEIILAPIDSAQFGRMEVGIETSNLTLLASRKDESNR